MLVIQSIKPIFYGKLGGLNKKFFDLFKKAVTFTPIDKIDDFIVNYICDIKDNVNISDMQENIRHYTELEKQANVIKNKISELEAIEENNNKYINERTKQYIQQYLIDRADKEWTYESINDLEKEKESLIKEVNELKINNENREQQLEQLKEEIDKLQEDLINSDQNKIAKDLENKITNLEEKIDKIDDTTLNISNRIRNKILPWEAIIKNTNKNFLDSTVLENFNEFDENVKYLSEINKDNIKYINLNCFDEMKNSSKALIDFGNEKYFNSLSIQKENLKKLNQLENEIKMLGEGMNVFDKNLLEFKDKLEYELENVFNKKIKVEILADLLEIKDEKWRNAIEGYLNTQRDYLLVEPEYFEEASKLYRIISKQNKEYHSFGLIDIEKVMAVKRNIQQNSLAEEILTNNIFAKEYVNYLLGTVIKCEEIKELRSYNISITPDCMLYKSFVLRKINPAIYEYPHIGKNSILKQKEIKEKQLNEVKKINESLEQIIKNSNWLKEIQILSDDFILELKENINDIIKKESYIDEYDKLKEKYDNLELSFIFDLREEKNVKEKIYKKIIDDFGDTRDKIGGKSTKIEIISQDILEKRNELLEKEKILAEKYTKEWEENIGNDRYIKENNTKTPLAIKNNYSNQIEKTKNNIESLNTLLVQLRTTFINKYQLSFNCLDDNNTEFAEALKLLKEVDLPHYIDNINDAKNKAYEQFREDFLAKLKANIDEANRQIKELNEALKLHKFGEDQYIFKVSPKEEYKNIYAMITDSMLMDGFNLASEQFNSKYKNEIKELFDKITTASISSEGNLAEYEKNIKIYTDYRTYLNFDLLVKTATGNEQRLSRTLSKKSGGETQTPFYISILASFAQLYRMRDFSNRKDSLINLVIFDEAFSKMDSDRIEESINLLRKFGFQAIFAAPSEKASYIIPFVDSTLCVYRQVGKATVVGKYENKED